MKWLSLSLSLSLLVAGAVHAEPPKASPAPTAKIITKDDFRKLLIGSKWFWENPLAPADRECVFMADGSFRHPRFIATYTIESPREVKLIRKGDKGTEYAKLTFDETYTHFEAVDFNKKGRITGRRQ